MIDSIRTVIRIESPSQSTSANTHEEKARHPLAGLPLPSANNHFCVVGRYRYSYMGLSPHQFMPISDVHKAIHSGGEFRYAPFPSVMAMLGILHDATPKDIDRMYPMGYNDLMIEIRKTEAYARWLND